MFASVYFCICSVFYLAVVQHSVTIVDAAPTLEKVNATIFGVDAAYIDVSANGTMMIVGGTTNATVYERPNIHSAWLQLGPVITVIGETGSRGVGVAMSADGAIVAVCNTSTVDVYKVNMSSMTNVWERVGTALVNETGVTDHVSIDLSADGSTIVVGRTGDGRLNGEEVIVYKYSMISDQWERVGSPLTNGPDPNDSSYYVYGEDVAIASDGRTIAFRYSTFTDSYEDSFVDVYQLNTTSEWEPVGYFNLYLIYNALFSLSMSADGSTIILGGARFQDEPGAESGLVQVYKLYAPSRQWTGEYIGTGEEGKRSSVSSVDISFDGTVIAFGERIYQLGAETHKVSVYQLTTTSSQYEQVLPGINECSDIADPSSCLLVGRAVAISGDGKSIVIDASSTVATYKFNDGLSVPPTSPPTQPPISTASPTKSPTNSPLSPSLSNYFTVVDAKTDKTIGLLSNLIPKARPPNSIDYSVLNTSSVSIESIFTVPNISVVQSVRMTLDSPSRTICERAPAFTLFGDVRGNVSGSPFTLGRRLVTASAYDGINCNGNRVGNISQSFIVRGCRPLRYRLYDADSDTSVSTLVNETTISNPPCKVNIGVTFRCGFKADTVVFKLRNTTANSVPILTRTEQSAPYFLFGDNGRGNIFPGTLPAGSYYLNIEIDGIVHPSIQFTLNACSSI